MIIIEYMFPAIYAQRDSIRLCVPLKTISNWGSHRAVHRSDLLRVSGRSSAQIVIASRLISSVGPERFVHSAAWVAGSRPVSGTDVDSGGRRLHRGYCSGFYIPKAS